MKEIAKRYNPKEYEEKWAAFWVAEKVFASKPDGRKPYTIVIPPPNVTGVLHMGHALNNVLQDIIIRFNKINNKNTLWMPGTDHGGIATQNVVEKILLKEGKTRHDLGREQFLNRMWAWKEESGDTIINQLKRLGCGCDWDRLRFTMDEGCSKAVQAAFIRLFEEGLIYRGNRMINWCPRCHTALSDIEVEHEEKESHLWYIKYPFSRGKKYVTVATTRPETMLGDTAVAVNPKDKRYKDFIGKTVKLPLTDREIPVIGDEFVDMEFGTGAVKVTPSHDPNDRGIAERHPEIEQKYVVIDRDGKMTLLAGDKYAGLGRFECRKKIIADLKSLLEKTEDYTHAVGVCCRCSSIIEPLDSLQWFLNMEEMSKAAADATRDGSVKFFPASWAKPYLNWLDNLKDWCLSRQIWWGHRLPIWYCLKCNGDDIFIHFNEEYYSKHEDVLSSGAAYNELIKIISKSEIFENVYNVHINEKVKPFTDSGKCPDCGSSDIIQDPDVLDTWFSSALWPFSTFGWPDDNEDLKYYYPTDVLVTGHEILYLWVARMVMMGLKLKNDIPYHNVYIHGIIRDEYGNKMSKSKGNVVDPIETIEAYGTDSLRFLLAKAAVPGRDIQLSDDDFIGARNFCNKLWNASRLVINNMTIKELTRPDCKKMELADKWILKELAGFTAKIKKGYEEFNNAHSARQIYEFTWKYYCDWYIELAKISLYSIPEKKETAEKVLLTVLLRILSMLHPIMPFITSQIWEHIKEIVKLPCDNILDFNGFDDLNYDFDNTELNSMNTLMDIISGIRNIRGENKIQPSVKLKVSIKADKNMLKLIDQYDDYIKVLGGVEELRTGEDLEKDENDAMAIIGKISVYVALPSEMKEQEQERIEKRIHEIKKLVDNAKKKLRNRDFMEKAPKEVVDAAKKRAEGYLHELKKIEKTMDMINKNKEKQE